MGFGETNLGSIDLRTRRLSNRFFTYIPTYLVFHSIINFIPFSICNKLFSKCVLIHIPFFQISTKLPLSWHRRQESWQPYFIFRQEAIVHILECISIMFCYSMVPLINSPISQTFDVTQGQYNTMFRKDLFKDATASHLFQCGQYLDCLKDNTPTLEIPLRENIKLSFMEAFASFA